MAERLIELLKKNLEGTLTDAELEAELHCRGFDDEEIETLWQARKEV